MYYRLVDNHDEEIEINGRVVLRTIMNFLSFSSDCEVSCRISSFPANFQDPNSFYLTEVTNALSALSYSVYRSTNLGEARERHSKEKSKLVELATRDPSLFDANKEKIKRPSRD